MLPPLLPSPDFRKTLRLPDVKSREQLRINHECYEFAVSNKISLYAISFASLTDHRLRPFALSHYETEMRQTMLAP